MSMVVVVRKPLRVWHRGGTLVQYRPGDRITVLLPKKNRWLFLHGFLGTLTSTEGANPIPTPDMGGIEVLASEVGLGDPIEKATRL